jgi:hypothetical protein
MSSEKWRPGNKVCTDCVYCEGYLDPEALSLDIGYHLICVKNNYWLPWAKGSMPLEDDSPQNMRDCTVECLEKAENCPDFQRIT